MQKSSMRVFRHLTKGSKLHILNQTTQDKEKVTWKKKRLKSQKYQSVIEVVVVCCAALQFYLKRIFQHQGEGNHENI